MNKSVAVQRPVQFATKEEAGGTRSGLSVQ
eukprot:SAG11_NODE_28447_length_321_cov_1.171171_2_plen_29_part_01